MDEATDGMGAAVDAETGHGRRRVGEWARPPTPNCTAANANEPTGAVANNERSGQRRDEARTPTRRRMGAAADAEKHGRRRKGEWGAKTMRGADANDGKPAAKQTAAKKKEESSDSSSSSESSTSDSED